MSNSLPGADVPRVRAPHAPDRAARIQGYLAETGDLNHVFCGPVEVQVRFHPHGPSGAHFPDCEPPAFVL